MLGDAEDGSHPVEKEGEASRGKHSLHSREDGTQRTGRLATKLLGRGTLNSINSSVGPSSVAPARRALLHIPAADLMPDSSPAVPTLDNSDACTPHAFLQTLHPLPFEPAIGLLDNFLDVFFATGMGVIVIYGLLGVIVCQFASREPTRLMLLHKTPTR